jgi:2-polyprenyl-3-methyl-5-hydroxy-6-metoxy-1,4-benzoquinol methylase
MIKKIKKRRCFQVPPKGTFQPNNADDPLPYYYKPFIGSIYCSRIEQGLNLLTPPYESILEMGYGSGLLLPSLSDMCNSLSGIDLNSNPKQVGKILFKNNVNCSLVKGDVLASHFPERSFDLIVAISIFEHIHDLSQLFNRIHELLIPGGQLLVGMPRVDPLMDKLFRLIGYDHINDHHVTNYKECLMAASKYFDLINLSSLPQWLPHSCGIYFNILFQKK